MMEYYPLLKALHIIFIVTWFAGLFYIIRLFIYFAEAGLQEEPKKTILQNQYKTMSTRLWYIITWPSAIITLILAILLLSSELGRLFLKQPWMHVKLSFVLLLYIYHGYSHVLYRRLQEGRMSWTSKKLRLWNELPTLILFSVVFLVVLKSALNWIFGVLGLMGLMIFLMIGIKFYQGIRNKKD